MSFTDFLKGGAAIVSPVAGAAIAGSEKDKSSQNYGSWIDAGQAGAFENAGKDAYWGSFNTLQDFVNRGPGGQDVTNATNSSRDLASMLANLSNNGGMPGQGDINNSNDIAARLFGAQRTQLGQNFQDQLFAANNQAALSGFGGNDPVLRAKLAQEQTRQASVLDAQQGAYAQNLAMQMPGQRLGYAAQRANVLGGLASQALQNRQMIAAMGSGIMDQERNFRLATAHHYGEQSSESGGGFKGAVEGGFAGMGAAMSLGKSAIGLGGMMGGGAGGAMGAGGGGFQMPSTPSSNFFSGANPYSMGGSGSSFPSAQNSYSLSGPAQYSGGNWGFGYGGK